MRNWQRAGALVFLATLMTGVMAPTGALAVPPLQPPQGMTINNPSAADPTDPDAPEPFPGSAAPDIISYDPATWATTYKCSFAGWDRQSVYWSCTVADRFTFAELRRHQGTFSSGSHNPGPWTIYRTPRAVCVQAHAHYQNWVSQSTTSAWACR